MISDDCLFFFNEISSVVCFFWDRCRALEALLGCGQLMSWDSFDTWFAFQHVSRWDDVLIHCHYLLHMPSKLLKKHRNTGCFPYIHIQQLEWQWLLYCFSLHLCVSRSSHFVQLWVKKNLVHCSWSFGPQGSRESQVKSWRSHMISRGSQISGDGYVGSVYPA